MIIGLCGGSGSGKGTVSSILNNYDIPAIDTDLVYHNLTSYMSDCLIEIRDAFGENVISNGALNRKELSHIVFSDESGDKRNLLNLIAHKHILASVRDRISALVNEGYEHVIVDAPVLFESGFDKECDLVIGVIANREVRISRIMARDGIDYVSAKRRIDSQLSDEELRKRCDYVITNDRGIDELKVAVSKIYDELIGGKNGKDNW